MTEKEKEEFEEINLMLPQSENGVKFLDSTSDDEDDEEAKSKADHIIRYLVTALICTSYLCLVSNQFI